MKIKEGIFQRLIAEELSKAISKRRVIKLNESVLKNVDATTLIEFAEAYAALSQELREDFGKVLAGEFDEVYSNVAPLKESFAYLHPEFEQAFKDYADYSALRG